MNAFIKELIDEHGISQKELANILGISSSAISQWKECSTMGVDALFKLSKLFQITVDELVHERRVAETPEHKWKRTYNLDDYEILELIENEDMELIGEYLKKVSVVNSRFYKLLYKKISGRATELEISEFMVLNKYFSPQVYNSQCFFNKRFDRPTEEWNIWIRDVLDESIGLNNEKAIIWELERIYKNNKMIDLKDLDSILDDDLFYVWYETLTQEQKDNMLSNHYRSDTDNEFLFEMMRRGGRVVYAVSDLPRMNYDYRDIEKAEGDVKPLKNLDKVMEILMSMYGKAVYLDYEQYQRLINVSAMERIEMEHKFKKRKPIKYWEYIKQGDV